MCMYVPLFCFCLPDFAFTICLGFIFLCVHVCVCFNSSLLPWQMASEGGSWFPNQKLAWVSGMGAQSPDAWPPENSWPRESINQCELLQRCPPKSRTQHHPTVCSTQCWIHHPTSQIGTQTQPSAVRLPTDTTKYTTLHGLAHQKEKNSLSPTRMQALVPPNMKPTQVTRPISPTGGRDQKQELQPYSLVKGNLKHSK